MTSSRAALFAAAALAAGAAQSQPALQDWQAIDSVTATVANALGRTATPIDRRIKLARCPEQVAVTAVDSQTLAVRCAPLGWRLRVAMTGPAGAAGAVATTARAPSAAPVIRRGDNVRVTLDGPNFSLSYAATAAEDGRLGETIALRNADTRSTLSAVVTGPGRAEIQH